MARLGDLLPFGRLFKAHSDNYFGPNRPNFWRLFGRFLKDGSNLNFLCYKENLNLKFWRNCHFGQLLHQKEYQKYVFLAIKEVRTDTKYHFGQLLLQKEDPKYAILTTKTSQNWLAILGDFFLGIGRLFTKTIWSPWSSVSSVHFIPDPSFCPILYVFKPKLSDHFWIKSLWLCHVKVSTDKRWSLRQAQQA